MYILYKSDHKNKNKWESSKSNRLHMSFRDHCGPVLQTYLSKWYHVIARRWEVSHRKKSQLVLFWMRFCLLACRPAASSWVCGTVSSSVMTDAWSSAKLPHLTTLNTWTHETYCGPCEGKARAAQIKMTASIQTFWVQEESSSLIMEQIMVSIAASKSFGLSGSIFCI